MSDQELIARLRDAPADGLGTENLCLEAADRIEELVKERDYTEGTNDTLIALNQALTAKLTKAVQALRKIADYTHIGESGQGVKQHAEARIARTTLAELEVKE